MPSGNFEQRQASVDSESFSSSRNSIHDQSLLVSLSHDDDRLSALHVAVHLVKTRVFLFVFPPTLDNLFSETLSLEKKSLSLGKKSLSLEKKILEFR